MLSTKRKCVKTNLQIHWTFALKLERREYGQDDRPLSLQLKTCLMIHCLHMCRLSSLKSSINLCESVHETKKKEKVVNINMFVCACEIKIKNIKINIKIKIGEIAMLIEVYNKN